jgi:hypothetical protein
MMNKNAKYLSSIALIAISLASAVYAAYIIGISVGTVTIQEPISFDKTAWTMSMYAGETQTHNITITNLAHAQINVSVSVAVTPQNQGVNASLSAVDGYEGCTWTSVNSTLGTLAMSSSASEVNVTVSVNASQSIPAGSTYNVTVTLSR